MLEADIPEKKLSPNAQIVKDIIQPKILLAGFIDMTFIMLSIIYLIQAIFFLIGIKGYLPVFVNDRPVLELGNALQIYGAWIYIQVALALGISALLVRMIAKTLHIYFYTKYPREIDEILTDNVPNGRNIVVISVILSTVIYLILLNISRH